MQQNTSAIYRFLGYSIFILMIGTNLPTPLYGVYKREWAFSSITLTLVFAVYALSIIPSLLLFGPMSDRVGRKKVLIPGLVVSAFGSLLFALAQNVSLLFIARAIQGLSVGILSGAATAALAEFHPRQDRRQAALIASVATAAGTAVGPLLSGLLAQYGPWPTVIPFAIHILLLVPGVIGLLRMPTAAGNQQNLGTWKPQRPSVPSEIVPSFAIAGATAFVAWAVTALFMSLVPSFVITLMHVHNLAVAGGVVFLMLGASSSIQMTMRKLQAGSAMVSGLVLLVVGLATVVDAVPNHAMWMLIVGTIVSGCGQGLAFMGSMALVNQVAPPARRADVISSFYVVIYLGVGLPIIGIGLVTQTVDLYHAVQTFAWVVGLVGWVLSLLVFVRQSKTRANVTTSA